MSVVQLEPPRDAWDDRTVSELLALASSRSADDRQRLLLKVTSLCDSNPPPPKVAPLLSDIFLALTAQAERDIRLALSERIAGVDWAPPALINMLALDEIEIARPVITSSPLLQNADLIRLLIEATLEHQIAVARRPHLARPVVDTIVDRAEPVTMTALASNRTADIGEEAMRKLVDHSRRIAGLRAPLTRHPRLNEQLAQQLYQWVGQALRQSIGERFRIDGAQLNAAVQDAAAKAVGSPEWRAMPARMTEDRARIDAERRLVEKLQTAGQLRPGLLVRALREQRFELFEQTLAVLGGFSEAQVHHAIRAPTAEPLYLACIAVGVDKAVFASLLVEVRKLSGGMPADGGWKATPMSAHAASRAFHQMMHKPATV
ncbi:uncharacterized protein (DUF2336 family) [Brevundimonas vesicularis]|uniref:Uncharacterized protein (DUF2336 family) n=1 Tax=Brevundimonas vesicularis TaxID=41276 RepID=A0A7W9FSX2_BREVE|nr:DUF2336 domain-containing protein [Brevundimonas vesicularis]MBB5770989.1 uncharacterized protein (DUF2336 family) [Brevundimonas vesicularis]